MIKCKLHILAVEKVTKMKNQRTKTLLKHSPLMGCSHTNDNQHIMVFFSALLPLSQIKVI